MKHDLHNDVKYSPAFHPAAAVTDNTAYVSEILDTQGYEANELVLQFGSIADVDATFVLLMEESVDSAMAVKNSVADANLVGTELLGAPLFSDDNSTKKLGVKGTKRYVRATLTPSANSGNIFCSMLWVQARIRHGA